MQKVEHIQTNIDHAEFLELGEKRLTGDGKRDMNRTNINDKYGVWLNNYEWDFFTTFTTRNSISLPSARRIMDDFATRMGCGGNRTEHMPDDYRHCRKTRLHNRTEYDYYGDKHVSHVNKCESDGVTRLFWAAEPFEVKEGEFSSSKIDPEYEHFEGRSNSTRYHMHGLFKTKYTFNDIRTFWNRKYGRIDLQNYDSGKKGSHYIAKYVTKEISDFDMRF